MKTLKRLRKEGQLCYDETTLGIKIRTVSADQCCEDDPMLLLLEDDHHVAKKSTVLLSRDPTLLLLHGPVLWNDDEEVTRKAK